MNAKIRENYPWQPRTMESQANERWKDIPGLEGSYRVSNFGRVKREAFEITCSNGHIRRVKSKMMTIEVNSRENRSIKDETHSLRTKIMSSGILYHFLIQRLVYYCFVRKFDMSDPYLLVWCKDGDGKNICPENLELVNPRRKQNRMFERHRYRRIIVYSYDEFARQGLEKSATSYCKQVSQYSMAGARIQTYPSINAASKALNLSSVAIVNVLKDRQVSHGGYVWRYGKPEKIDMKSFRENKTLHYKKLVGRKLTQYSTQGERIAAYLTIADAARATGTSSGDISCVLNGKQRSAGGYIWKKGWGKDKIDLSNYLTGAQYRGLKRQKKIRQYSAGGKYIRTFPSVKQAAEKMGISPSAISTCLNQERKLAKGFIWKAADRKR
jgi:hypothetical protein